MSENPFSEPGDQDRTVIRPMPGGARGAARAAVPAPAQAAVPVASGGPDLEAVAAGDNPLAIAAAPLLNLLARLRNTATAPDPGDMRERTRRELRAFERRAKEAGVPADQLRMAHYALCAALDDVVLNTPWGSRGRWRDEPLAAALHKDEHAGEGFFDQLRTLRKTLPESLAVVELMFVCLSLGMMGPYRAAPDGGVQLERVRRQVFGLVEKPGSAALTLAPEAGGIALPRERRGGLPVWVVFAGALAVVAGVYVWCLASLNGASDEFYRAAVSAPPDSMPTLVRPPATPPPPPPPEPAAPGPAERLQAALAGVQGVEVIGTPAAVVVRIPARLLFPAASATVTPATALDAVAQALREVTGPIRVLGYTDSEPTRTVAFPSKFALSNARALAVRAVLARTSPEPGRIAAEGRADADPVAPNATPEGRERNRRVEIVVAKAP